ncbi:MAG: LysR family transcriptional regulator [Proteobacteria bacterium]|nr:LysR family transcriptional regulator [Pseudomonadota bacterium]
MSTMRVRFRVHFGRDVTVGPGKIELLEHIARAGSLSQAARAMDMSYRRAWVLLNSMNTSYREPVVITAKGGRGGGGATLTAFGRELIRIYRQFDKALQRRAARSFTPIAGQLAGERTPRAAKLR